MPRFVVVLAAVGAVALVAAVVAVALTYESSATQGEQLQASAETTGEPAAPFTDADEDGVPDGPPVVDEFETVADGPSAAELAAEAADGVTDDVVAVAKGEPLPSLSAMPEGTLSLIALPEGFESARFEVTFAPYGWGQGGPDGCCLVIAVEDATPAGGNTGGVTPIAGQNVSVWIDLDDRDVLAEGGEFNGTIEVRRQGDVGALFLTGVSGS